MPVIVYKTLTLEIHYVQARRLACGRCRQVFTYVWGDQQSFEVKGIPVVSSDEGMRKSALKKAGAALGKVANAPNKGLALCPHCRCYQDWMVRSARRTFMGCGSGIGLVIAGALAIAAGVWWGAGAPVVIGLIAAGTILGLVVGMRLGLDAGPHPDRKEPHSLVDAEIPPFLEACKEKKLDPILAWYVSAGNKPGEKELLVSLGVLDTSRQRPLFPRELWTAVAVKQFD